VLINNIIGNNIIVINFFLLKNWKNIEKLNRIKVKKTRDSYKLLNGKCLVIIQRIIKCKNILIKERNNKTLLILILFLKKLKLKLKKNNSVVIKIEKKEELIKNCSNKIIFIIFFTY